MGPPKRGFSVNHPAPQVQPPEQFCKLFGIGEDTGRTGAAEFAALPQLLQGGEELAAENLSEDWDRQEEITSRRYPAASVGRQTTGRNYAVDVWVQQQILSPGMQDGNKADVRTQPFRVGRHFEQGGGSGGKQ